MHTSYLRIADFWLVIALALACNPVLAAQKNTAGSPFKAGSIVKWVDEKGVTHYGDTIPPQYSGRDSSELNRQGRVVKRNNTSETQANKAAAAETKVSAKQQRHDKALLAAYTTEQEFDLARDRNLQTDQAAVEGLNQRMNSVKERLAAAKKTADGFSQRKKPVPPHVTEDLKVNQGEIAKIEAQIAERQQSMEATRQRFEKDKQRFIQLKLNPNAPPPPETSTPIAAPAPGLASEATEPAPATPAVPTVPKPVATTAPMAAPKAPTAKLAPTLPPAAKPAPAPKPAVPAAPEPVAEKPAVVKPVKKIKRVVMP